MEEDTQEPRITLTEGVAEVAQTDKLSVSSAASSCWAFNGSPFALTFANLLSPTFAEVLAELLAIERNNQLAGDPTGLDVGADLCLLGNLVALGACHSNRGESGGISRVTLGSLSLQAHAQRALWPSLMNRLSPDGCIANSPSEEGAPRSTCFIR